MIECSFGTHETGGARNGSPYRCGRRAISRDDVCDDRRPKKNREIFSGYPYTTLSFILLSALASVSLLQTCLLADDSVPSAEEKQSDSKSNDAAPEEKPKEKSFLEKLGEDLLKDANDAPGTEANARSEDEDKMDRVVKGMRNAGDKLDEGFTADETQKIQKQVIKDLDDIINQLENPPPGQGGGGGGGGSGSSGGGSNRKPRGGGGSSYRLQRPQGAGRQRMSTGKQQNQSSSEEKSSEENKEGGSDSSKQMQAKKKASEEAERRRKLEMDIWGHLPPHLREELLSTYGERMLPKYEHLVKQFYESLSTQQDPQKK